MKPSEENTERKSTSSKCLLLIWHRQLENYLLSIRESYLPAHLQDLFYRIMFWHLPTNWLLTEVQYYMLYRFLVPIHSSDVCWKLVSGSGKKILTQLPACRMDTRENSAANVSCVAAPQRVPLDTCTFSMPKTPYPWTHFSTNLHVLPIGTPKQDIWVNLQAKDWAKINIKCESGVWIWDRRWLSWSVLSPDFGMKI